MLTERIAACPDFAPGRWIPCPPVRDRAAWDTLPGFDRWLYGGGEAARAARQIPPLPLHLWLDFTQTGNRARYEHAYFTRRRLLCRCGRGRSAARRTSRLRRHKTPAGMRHGRASPLLCPRRQAGRRL